MLQALDRTAAGWTIQPAPGALAADAPVFEREAGLPPGSLLDARVLAQALHAPAPTVGDLESSLAAMRTAPLAQQEAALVDVHIDALWRGRSARGLRVDTDELERRIAEREARRAVDRRRLNVDPASDSDAARRWVQRLGVVPLDVHGEPARAESGLPSLNRDDRERARVPESKRETWDAYAAARASAKSIPKLLEIAVHTDGDALVHPTITAAGARTGRQTVSGPALHGLPAADRDVLRAAPGRVLVGADCSQVEPKVAAWLSGCAAMRAAVQVDAYDALAGRIGVTRPVAKVVTLAGLYGEGDAALAGRLQVSLERAREIRAAMRAAWPGFAVWSEAVTADTAPMMTLFDGAVIKAPHEPYIRVNSWVQGTAARLFKRSTLAAAAAGLDPWLPVHDELTVECEPGDAPDAARALETAIAVDLGPVQITATAVQLGEKWGHP